MASGDLTNNRAGKPALSFSIGTGLGIKRTIQNPYLSILIGILQPNQNVEFSILGLSHIDRITRTLKYLYHAP